MEIGGFVLGLREGVIALIAGVAFYMVFVLLRMRRLHTRPAPVPLPEAAVAEGKKEDTLTLAEALASPVQDVPEIPASTLAEAILRQDFERELALMREELDAVRGELAALRQDMLQELAHFRAAQTVSPIYGDAMQMAMAGYDPVMIAERCGIARAEAELVAALAKSQGQ